MFFIYVSVCICHVCAGASRGQKRARLLELEYQAVVSYPMLVLAT